MHPQVKAGGKKATITGYIVNRDQPYRVTVDSPQPVETFNIFFARGFLDAAAEAGESVIRSDEEHTMPLHFYGVCAQSKGKSRTCFHRYIVRFQIPHLRLAGWKILLI